VSRIPYLKIWTTAYNFHLMLSILDFSLLAPMLASLANDVSEIGSVDPFEPSSRVLANPEHRF